MKAGISLYHVQRVVDWTAAVFELAVRAKCLPPANDHRTLEALAVAYEAGRGPQAGLLICRAAAAARSGRGL